ncbi:hypothetical protein MY11210_006897 [Beauveria gryllotalpidicola]
MRLSTNFVARGVASIAWTPKPAPPYVARASAPAALAPDSINLTANNPDDPYVPGTARPQAYQRFTRAVEPEDIRLKAIEEAAEPADFRSHASSKAASSSTFGGTGGAKAASKAASSSTFAGAKGSQDAKFNNN